MSSSVNGIPACVHKFLLTDVLRNEWGFKGYVVSDSHAITDVIDNHKIKIHFSSSCLLNDKLKKSQRFENSGCIYSLNDSVENI